VKATLFFFRRTNKSFNQIRQLENIFIVEIFCSNIFSIVCSVKPGHEPEYSLLLKF